MVMTNVPTSQNIIETLERSKLPLARLVEVFSSIQGEGTLVGFRQLFIRTYGCNLRCSYCDSPETLKESGSPPLCRVEDIPGSGQFRFIENPVSSVELTQMVMDSFREAPHHSISLTGGEPLLYAKFWKIFLPPLRGMGIKVFLETNGLLPEHLLQVISLVDYVSMDFKAPSATGVDESVHWNIQQKFLEIAQRANVYGKLVITPGTSLDELDRVVDIIYRTNPSIPLIIQPVTPYGNEPDSVSSERIFEIQSRASEMLGEVRVIPQTHKMIRLL